MPLPPHVRRERRAYNKLHNPPPEPAPVSKSKFRRKRCDNCFELFEMFYTDRKGAKRPVVAHKRFCSENCKKEFHQNGGAFGPLKARLEKIVRSWMRSYQEDIDTNIIRLTQKLEELEKEVARVERNQTLDVKALRDEIRMEADSRA